MPYDIDYTRCNHCGKCVEACHKHVFYPEFGIFVSYYRFPFCDDCGACVKVCKRKALFYVSHDYARISPEYSGFYRKKLTNEQAKQLLKEIMEKIVEELSEEEKQIFFDSISTYRDVNTMIERSPVFKKVYSELIKRFEKAIQL